MEGRLQAQTIEVPPLSSLPIHILRAAAPNPLLYCDKMMYKAAFVIVAAALATLGA